MPVKNLRKIRGDSLTLGVTVSKNGTPVDLSTSDTVLYGHVLDAAGVNVIKSFDIQPVALEEGKFNIYLSPRETRVLRGEYTYVVKYEKGDQSTTLVGGTLIFGGIQ